MCILLGLVLLLLFTTTSTSDILEAVRAAHYPRSRDEVIMLRQRKTTFGGLRKPRTYSPRGSFNDYCEESQRHCFRIYNTSQVCARTSNYNYRTFHHYCAVDFMNCMERYEVWQIFHVGACFELKDVSDFKHHRHYEEENDYFLDQYRVYDYDI